MCLYSVDIFLVNFKGHLPSENLKVVFLRERRKWEGFCAFFFPTFKAILFTCHAALMLCDRSSFRSLCFHSFSTQASKNVHGLCSNKKKYPAGEMKRMLAYGPWDHNP